MQEVSAMTVSHGKPYAGNLHVRFDDKIANFKNAITIEEAKEEVYKNIKHIKGDTL